MRQLKEQIDVLLKESADRKRLRQPDTAHLTPSLSSVKKKERTTPSPAPRPITPAVAGMDTPKGRGRGRGTPSGPLSSKRPKKVPVGRGRPPPVPAPVPTGPIAEGISYFSRSNNSLCFLHRSWLGLLFYLNL